MTKRRRGHGVYLGKRGNGWRISYWIDTPEGRKQRTESFKNYDDAKARKRILDGNGPRSDGRTTVKVFLEDWLRALENDAGMAPTTVKSYSYKLRRYIIDPMGEVPLRRLTPKRLSAVLAAVPKGTVRVVRHALSSALNAAVDQGELGENPLRRVSLGKKPPKQKAPETWTKEEIAAFLTAAVGDRLEGAWRLLAVSGARAGEVLGLPTDSFSEVPAAVTIRQQVTSCGGRSIIAPVKEKRSNRTVAVDARTIALLKQRAVEQKQERLLAGDLWQGDEGLLFTGPAGGRIHPTTFRKHFTRLVKAAGIRTGTPHKMRHSHATHLLGDGFGLPDVAQRLGHSKEVCLAIYGHSQKAAEDAAARAIAGWFGG